MPLAAGQRLGPYEILAPLGAGGMGEVYRARDPRLKRDVAIKVLPGPLAHDRERMLRFEREAQVLASLSHPHIAAIHGLEEADGIRALVLELVEGPTLAERIARGPISVPEALPIAREIAEALEAAHERGIVHRDLKPANVKLTAEGHVKVLDFGLARAMDAEPPADPGLSHSPTLSVATQAGVVLGTAAYMSPEQARGKRVDKRADVWAFGCVLFEMLTARRLFSGETVSDTLAAVLRAEIDWRALPTGSPRAVESLLRRCLDRDPGRRLRDIGEARIVLEDVIAGRGEEAPASAASAGSALRRWRWPALAGALAAGLIAWGWGGLRPSPDPGALDRPGPTIRSTVELPADQPLSLGTHVPLIGFEGPVLALSPDGSRLAYVGRSGAQTQVFLRALNQLAVQPIPGTEGAIHAFFSPDGESIGFLTNDRVKRVSVHGGAPVTLSEARVAVRATWARDDHIYFTEDQSWNLSRVAARGGASREILIGGDRARAVGVSLGQVLPDGKTVLGTRQSGGISGDHSSVVLVSIGTLKTKVLIQSGYDGRFMPPDRIVFGRAGSLWAVRFDPVRHEVLSEPAEVASDVSMDSLFAQVHAAFSDNGLVAYVPGGDRSVGRLAFVSRNGATEFLALPPRVYNVVDLAPRGDRLAVQVADVADYVLVFDLARREERRLSAAESTGWPVWSPDGLRVAYVTYRSMIPNDNRKLSVRAVDGRSEPADVPGSGGLWSPTAWSPDGRVIALVALRGSLPTIGFLSERGDAQWLPEARFNQIMPCFSPDGRYVAYASDESGRFEIWVRPYPELGAARQLSTDGGLEPVWTASGELFYRSGRRFMSTRVTTHPSLAWGPPRLAFETDFIDTNGVSYDITPDGRRLLVVKRVVPDAPTRIQLVSNWRAALDAEPSARP